MDKSVKYIVGIDEVGRGPIAGPVCVASFMVRRNYELPINNYEFKLPKLKDSKKLSKKQREIWFNFLKGEKEKGNCDYAVSFVSSENIDKFGIAKCIQKALDKSLSGITNQDYKNFRRLTLKGSLPDNAIHMQAGDTSENFYDPDLYQIFLDGGLHAPKEFIHQETIIKGDELHPIISMASIVAKVSRDRIMTNYAVEYPEYGFERHVGYGTKAHYEAIKKHGQTKIHRKTFIH
ncbi:MAG: ribonuclease HII [Candidatus Paceibacterota bacterium]|jgi:ribonuclease HII